MAPDVLSPEQRRRCMSHIRGKNTKPERIVRSLVHRLGFRFRLNDNRLVGKPDLVLPRLGKIIFVHGCFWHKHSCKQGKVIPKTNAKFWNDKRGRNVERDKHVLSELRKSGWKVLVVWECWTSRPEQLAKRLLAFLADKR